MSKGSAADAFDVESYCAKLANSGSEHGHQRAFFGWLNYVSFRGLYPLAGLCYAVPNGGKRDPATAARLKAEGVKAGVPDVVYPVPRQRFASLYMELKVDKGRASEVQEWWHAQLRACGHAVAVCWGWQAARQCFLDYESGAQVQEVYR